MNYRGSFPARRRSPLILAAAVAQESNSRPSSRKSNALTAGLNTELAFTDVPLLQSLKRAGAAQPVDARTVFGRTRTVGRHDCSKANGDG